MKWTWRISTLNDPKAFNISLSCVFIWLNHEPNLKHISLNFKFKAKLRCFLSHFAYFLLLNSVKLSCVTYRNSHITCKNGTTVCIVQWGIHSSLVIILHWWGHFVDFTTLSKITEPNAKATEQSKLVKILHNWRHSVGYYSTFHIFDLCCFYTLHILIPVVYIVHLHFAYHVLNLVQMLGQGHKNG